MISARPVQVKLSWRSIHGNGKVLAGLQRNTTTGGTERSEEDPLRASRAVWERHGDLFGLSGGRARPRADARVCGRDGSGPPALDAEEGGGDVVRVALEVVPRAWEIGDLQPVEEAQRGVPQARHDSRAMACANLRPVLVGHPVPFPVQLTFDAPSPRTHAPRGAAVASAGARSVRPNTTSMRGWDPSNAVTWRSIRNTWPRGGQASSAFRTVVVRTVRVAIRPWPRSTVWAGGGKILETEGGAGLRQRGVVPCDFHHIMRGFLLDEEPRRGGLRRERVGGDDGPGHGQRRQ